MKEAVVGVSQFKARCLRLLEDVHKHGDRLVITKRGRPVARVLPVPEAAKALRGTWEGIVTGDQDIVYLDWSSDWEANR
jgi:prevent-host-death family protein